MILSELHFLFVIINIMVISNTTKIVRIVSREWRKNSDNRKNKQELNRNWNPWKNRKFHTQLCDINTDKIGFSDLLYWFSGSGNRRCKWTKEMSLHFKHLGEHCSKNPRFKHSSLALISNWGFNSLRNCLAQHWQLGPFKLYVSPVNSWLAMISWTFSVLVLILPRKE